MSDWAIGDLCTAIYSEDSTGYAAEIKDISQDDQGSSYAVVEFQGYGNVETVWLEDLLPPPLPENGFTLGGHARILQSKDNQEYEVEILALNDLKASVKVIGSETIESVPLNELMGSRGPSARQTQETILLDGNNNKSHDSNMNVTLHPDNSSAKEEKYNLTLQPIDSDTSYHEQVGEDVKNTTIFPENTSSPTGILKVTKEIDAKLVLIDSLSETRSAFETLTQKYAQLEKEYTTLQAVFDEECVKSSSLEDEKKDLRSQVEKTKSLYSDENLDLKKKLKEMMDRQRAWDIEKKNLETRILSLSNEINKLGHTADDTVLSYREKIQQLEFELNELRLTSKEGGGNTSGGSEAKNPNNNSLNTTISLDRDDSVSLMQSPLRGNHPIVSLSHESERNYTNLLHAGPVNMGQFQLQPVLCYFPVLASNTPNLMPQPLNSAHSPTTPTFRGSTRTPNGGGLRELRRPLPMTEFQSRCPNSEGRIHTICMEPNGSTALVKELEDPDTTVSRITQICDELKGYISNVCKDKWGHQVVLSLLFVSPCVLCYEIITEVWENFTSIMESTYGLTVILSTLKRIPTNEKFALMVERAVINHGILSLMLIEGGNHIINSIIDRFKPNYIVDCVNKNVLKLALSEHGSRVLSKALAVYSHDRVISAIEYVLSNIELIEKDAPQGLSIFEAVLENHITGGITADHCLNVMSTSLNPNFKMVLNRILESAPLGSSPLKRL